MRIKKYKLYTPLKIWWDDILSDSEWHTKDFVDKAKAEPIVSVGFFLAHKNKELKICHDVAEDGSSDYQVIPVGCITKIVELLETK